MTTYVFNTATTTLGAANLPLASDAILVTASGSVAAPTQTIDSSIYLVSDLKISVAGLLYLSQISLGGGDVIQVASTGTIMGSGSAPVIVMGMNSGYSRLTNDGAIINGEGLAVLAQGINDSIVNNGTIDGYLGVSLSGAVSSGQHLTNNGLITGFSAAVSMTGASTVSNFGQLSSQFDQALYAQSAAAIQQSVFNSGTIATRMGSGIYLNLTNAGAVFKLANSGEIYGVDYAIRSVGSSADLITNTGRLIGAVDLGAGNDNFIGQGGEMQGSLFLGNGSNFADLRNSLITGYVYGGNSSDYYMVDKADITIIEGGADVDQVAAGCSFTLGANIEYLTLLEGGAFSGKGNSAANQINGNSSDNSLFGYDGIDSLNGDLGDDRLFGGTGNDVFFGGDGDDRLYGQAGTDSIKGDAGDDTLQGGTGKDTLFGGDGADVFAFGSLGQAGGTPAQADIISDFVASEDMIDLSGIDAKSGLPGGNDAFTFIGNAAFSSKAGELRFSVSGTAIVLEMDVNGDGVADGFIRLSSTATISADNLIL